MPTDAIEAVAFMVGAVFLTGMVAGAVLMMASAIIRRRGSVVAARLLISGPPGGLCAAAIYLLALDFVPLALRVPLIVIFLVMGIPLLAAALRAKIAFAPIGHPRG